MSGNDSCCWEIVYAQNRKIGELLKTIRQLRAEKGDLERELTQIRKEYSEYQEMAESYGIDAKTMCALAKSQIKTCADNIRLREELEERRVFARDVVRFFATCSSPDPFLMKIIDHCRELAEVDGEL